MPVSAANRINREGDCAVSESRPMRFLRHRHPTCRTLWIINMGVTLESSESAKKLASAAGMKWNPENDGEDGNCTEHGRHCIKANDFPDFATLHPGYDFYASSPGKCGYTDTYEPTIITRDLAS